MNPLIKDANRPITLLGGGKILPKVARQALDYAPILVAVDGGAKVALELGHMPDAVVGDFDSVDQATLAQIPHARLHRISEQDSTDFDKCLRTVKAPLMLGVGFTGGRLDHELAAYNALARYPAQRCILLGEVDLCFLLPASVQLELPIGTRVSLFAMGPCQVDATGLRWPLRGLDMAPDGAISTSNEVTEAIVSVQTSVPKLLVILPREHLETVIKAVMEMSHDG